jgi:hypothetical protein
VRTYDARRETPILKRIQIALSHGAVRLFRNNVGLAWQGKCLRVSAMRLIIDSPRVVHFGLAEGSADLIGFKSVTITPEMVGTTIAQFVSIEVKRLRGGEYRENQRAWAAMIEAHGGLSGVARSIKEATALLQGAAHDGIDSGHESG